MRFFLDVQLFGDRVYSHHQINTQPLCQQILLLLEVKLKLLFTFDEEVFKVLKLKVFRIVVIPLGEVQFIDDLFIQDF